MVILNDLCIDESNASGCTPAAVASRAVLASLYEPFAAQNDESKANANLMDFAGQAVPS